MSLCEWEDPLHHPDIGTQPKYMEGAGQVLSYADTWSCD